MGWGLTAVAIVATSVAWLLVRRGVSIWVVMPTLSVALGIVGVVAADPAVSEVALAAQLGWGIGSGWALYLGTRLAVPLLGRIPAFAPHARAEYEASSRIGLVAAAGLSLVVLIGEELVWRLGVLRTLDLDPAPAAAVAWVAYVGANLASGSLPIVSAALVGGAVWTGVAWITGGVLAPLVSHAIWTTMMLVLPPALVREKMGP
jgi:hypothetical protein